MKSGHCRIFTLAVMTATLCAAPVAFAAEPAAPTKTVTVYVGVHFGKKKAAEEINEMHATMEKDGWRFADMETNTENGDTEGFWVTYTRP